MTKYLIIGLVLLIIVTAIFLFTNKPTPPAQNTTTPQTSTRPLGSGGIIPEPSTFIVPSSTPLASQNVAKYQSDTDKKYADQLKQQDDQYPWLQQLPLQSDKYFVYFDTSTNSFTAEIYSSTESEQIKQEILQKLNALNIDVSKYKIKWEIKPQ